MEPKGKGGGYRHQVEQLVEKRLRSSWGRPNTPLHKQTVASEMHEMIIKIPDDDDTGGTEELRKRLWSEVERRCESHPQEVSRIDCRGRTCLHVACTKNPPVSVAIALIAAASSRHYEAIVERDKHGSTPLSLAVASSKRNCCSIEVIRRLLQSCPRAAAVSDHNGFLPLHTACRKHRNGRNEIVEMLLDAYPDGAARECNSGRTPLHCAIAPIENGTPQVELVTLLALAYPESVVMNGCGTNPLFLAIRKRCDPAIILALVDANSDAVTSRDRCHGFPFRRAVEQSAPLVVLQALLPDVSAEVIVLDVDSITHDIALHSALECGVPHEELARLLLKPAPQQAALCQSRHGTTPLSMACRHFLEGIDRKHLFWGTISLFLRAAWYNRIDDNHNDEEAADLLVHAAVGLGTPVQVIDMAIELHPEQLSQRDQDGAFPLHLVLDTTGSTRNNDDERTQLILRILKAYPAAAATPTRQGQTTLELAVGARPIVGPQVLNDLVVANPEALRRLDPRSGFYPFQMAAVAATDESKKNSATAERMQLTAIFTLLVGAPDLAVTTFS